MATKLRIQMQGFIPERSRNNQGQNTSKQHWQRQGKRVIHKTDNGQGRQQNNQKHEGKEAGKLGNEETLKV